MSTSPAPRRSSRRLQTQQVETEKPATPTPTKPVAVKVKKQVVRASATPRREIPDPDNDVYPYMTMDDTPVSEQAPDYSRLEEPLSVRESHSLAHTLQKSRNTWLLGAMFEKYWTRPPRGKKNADGEGLKEATKLCDCAMVMGPHIFDVKLFVAKDENPDEEDEIEEAQQTPGTPGPSSAPMYPRPTIGTPGTPVTSSPGVAGPIQNTPQTPGSAQATPQASTPEPAISQASAAPTPPVPQATQSDPSPVDSSAADASTPAAPEVPPEMPAPSNEVPEPAESHEPSSTAQESAPGGTTEVSATIEPAQPAVSGTPEPVTPAAAPGPAESPAAISPQPAATGSTGADVQAPVRPGIAPQPVAPRPAEPEPITSASNQETIAKLQWIAARDLYLNELMKIVASGKASPEQIASFQVYINRARGMAMPADLAARFQYQAIRPAGSPYGYQNRARQPMRPVKPARTPKAKPAKPVDPNKKPRSTYTLKRKLKNIVIVFEFKDNPANRFLLPKDSILELLPTGEILVSFLAIKKVYPESTEEPPKKKSKAKSRKQKAEDEEPKQEPTIYYTPITVTIQKVPPRSIQVIERCVRRPARVVQNMEEVLEKGTRMASYSVWYQVEADDTELVQVLQEPPKLPEGAFIAPRRTYKARKKRGEKDEDEELDAEARTTRKRKTDEADIKKEPGTEGEANPEKTAETETAPGVTNDQIGEKPSSPDQKPDALEARSDQPTEKSTVEPTAKPDVSSDAMQID